MYPTVRFLSGPRYQHEEKGTSDDVPFFIYTILLPIPFFKKIPYPPSDIKERNQFAGRRGII